MWQRTVDCLGVAVGVTSQLASVAGALDAVFRTYAEATTTPDLTFTLMREAWPCLARDGAVIARYDEELDLVPALEIELYAQVMARARGLLVHAGAVVDANGAAIVVAGRSGAGKSTLVRALLARGLAYLTEESVALLGDRRGRGLARSLHVDDDAVAVPAGFTWEPYVLRHGATPRSTRLFHPPPARVWRGEARVAALAVIDHAPDASGELVALSGGEALHALWPVVFRRDADALADAASGLAGIPAVALRTSSPQQAEARVLELARRHGVEVPA